MKKDLLLHNRGCDRRSQAIRDFSPMAFQIIYEHHLDNGYTPFYLVDVYQQETLFLRVLYTYDGACLSIVKPGEDFAQYSSPDPVFSDAYPLSQEQWLRLPYLSVEEKYDHQPFWRITICRAAADKKALREDDSLNKMYAVKIDAYTGNVLDLYQVSHDTPDYEWRY